MLQQRIERLVRETSERMERDRLAMRAIAAARRRRDAVPQTLFAAVLRNSPDFQSAHDEGFAREGTDHAREHFDMLLTVASNRPVELLPDPFAFIRAHAVLRARQQFPLTALLHAYRLGQTGLWAVMREAVLSLAAGKDETIASLLLLSDFIMEYSDITSTILTEAYLAEERVLNSHRTRLRAALIEDLLRGLPPRDAEAAAWCEQQGIRPGLHQAIAVARPLSPRPDDPRPVLHSFSMAMEQSLAGTGIGKLVDIRREEVIAIGVHDDAPARRMAAALRSAALPLSIGIGISLDAPDTAALPRAYEEAERALGFAGPERQVVALAEIELGEFLLHRPDAVAFRLIPAWAERLTRLDRSKAGELTRTIRAFTDCSLNVKRTAKRLGLHTNTLYFRLNRIRSLTGVDPRSFSGASELLTVLRLLETRGSEATHP
jgi:PucR-like helix-turn-helix protein/diguanylate cyclase with GGDEF domain